VNKAKPPAINIGRSGRRSPPGNLSLPADPIASLDVNVKAKP